VRNPTLTAADVWDGLVCYIWDPTRYTKTVKEGDLIDGREVPSSPTDRDDPEVKERGVWRKVQFQDTVRPFRKKREEAVEEECILWALRKEITIKREDGVGKIAVGEPDGGPVSLIYGFLWDEPFVKRGSEEETQATSEYQKVSFSPSSSLLVFLVVRRSIGNWGPTYLPKDGFG
jgi:hypothetical protein